MEISLYTPVWVAINSINKCEVEPIVDYTHGHIFVLNTSQAHLGSLLYTVFNKITGCPIESWSAKFSSAHVIGNIILGPVPKIKLTYIVDCSIPNYCPVEPLPIGVIPGCYGSTNPYKI